MGDGHDGMIDVEEEEECTIYVDECIASLLQKLIWLYRYWITLAHTLASIINSPKDNSPIPHLI